MKEKLNVFILISSDIRLKPKVLHKLLLNLGNRCMGVAEVKYATSLTSNSRSRKLSQREYWGTAGFLRIAVQHIGLKLLEFLPLPNAVKYRTNIAGVCRFFEVPHQVVRDINSPVFVSGLQQKAPDVLVSLQRQILKKPILDTPSVCCINCHPSSLPKYRGPDPIFAALNADEPEIGITAHTMTPQIDEGRILAQITFDVKPHYSVLDSYAIAHDYYAEAIIEALAKIADGNIDSFPEVPANTPYHPAPDKQAVVAFTNRGRNMV